MDIGFAFLPHYEGKGYAYESAVKMMQLAKEVFKLTHIQAITVEENQASRRLIEKLGFTFDKMVRLENDPVELMMYTIVLQDENR